jgi:hypothetical protein
MPLPLRSAPRHQHGFIAVHALFVGLLLLGISVAFLGNGLAETRSVSQYESSTVALELAETGLVRAEMEFRSQVDADGTGLGNVSGEWRGGDFETQGFDVDATPGSTAGTWVLRATGNHRMAVRRVELGLRVTLPFVFQHALFAKDQLIFDSSFQTDSYDSRLGTYASQATRNDALGAYAEAGGHVGSNSSIEVRGSARVRGDARPGPPAGTTSLIGGSSYVSGNRARMAAPYDVPDPALDDFLAAYAVNDNARDVSSGTDRIWDPVRKNITVNSNAVLQLRGGTYFFNNMLFDGNGTLRVDAPSTIYVTGRFRFDSSSRINWTGRPQDLKFIAHPYAIVPGYTPPADDITINSSVTGRFTLYAPGRNITLNSSVDLYGAIVGRRITATSSGRMHYDKALLDASSSAKAVTERLYWRELNAPGR